MQAWEPISQCASHYIAPLQDGHFVPNLTLGAPIVKSLRKHTAAFLDVHLMVTHPAQVAGLGGSAGLDEVLQMCKNLGHLPQPWVDALLAASIAGLPQAAAFTQSQYRRPAAEPTPSPPLRTHPRLAVGQGVCGSGSQHVHLSSGGGGCRR